MHMIYPYETPRKFSVVLLLIMMYLIFYNYRYKSRHLSQMAFPAFLLVVTYDITWDPKINLYVL